MNKLCLLLCLLSLACGEAGTRPLGDPGPVRIEYRYQVARAPGVYQNAAGEDAGRLLRLLFADEPIDCTLGTAALIDRGVALASFRVPFGADFVGTYDPWGLSLVSGPFLGVYDYTAELEAAAGGHGGHIDFSRDGVRHRVDIAAGPCLRRRGAR